MADIELTSINERKGLPRSYRFNPFLRWTTMLFAALALGYSIYVLLSGRITADTSTFYKVVPFIIMFLAVNSLWKNLISLNSIRFEPSRIRFSCLLLPAVNIGWSEMRRMEFIEGRMRLIRLHFERDGEMKKHEFSINFPNMLEIINSIDEMAPHIEADSFLENVLVRRKVKPVKVTPPPGEED